MKVLDEVQSWMNFMGWSDGGNPGSVKRGDTSQIIARHGDSVWIADVQEAIEKTERAAAVAELERRIFSKLPEELRTAHAWLRE